MRLINVTTNRPLVEFEGEKILFHNKYLEKEMKQLGIPIPNGLRGVFDGVDYVYLHDPHFQRAFREIYYASTMDTEKFQWFE